MPRPPILIMAFSRPDYLRAVLDSLMAQQNCDLNNRPIFLLQDGERNRFSQRRYGKPDLIAQSLAVFRDTIPGGIVMASDDNLGVALNFDRAERFVFEERKDPAAIFLEEDMVLSPHYIAALDALLATHADDDRIGYVAAYGDHRLTLAEQKTDPSQLTTMHHNWAFGLYRRHWNAMRPHVEQYLTLVGGMDYRLRNEAAITALYESWGFGRNATSQDAAKTMATLLTGAIKIKTRACLARYIGERGLHMSPSVYAQRGFAQTEMYPDPLTEQALLTDQAYRRITADLRRWAGTPATDARRMA